MLTRTMRIDLLPRGIRVAEVAPGMVETEFSEVRFKGDEERAASVYKGVHLGITIAGSAARGLSTARSRRGVAPTPSLEAAINANAV